MGDFQILIEETSAMLLLNHNSSDLSPFTPICNEISYRGKPLLSSLLPALCFDFSRKLFMLTANLRN